MMTFIQQVAPLLLFLAAPLLVTVLWSLWDSWL